MLTIRCGSCDATFPEGSIEPHGSGQCPRCRQLFHPPRPASLPHARPELGPADLAIPSFCSICGCVLAAAERAGVHPTCNYPGCVHRRVANELAAVHARAMVALREQRTRVEQKVRELEIDIEGYPGIAILPANSRQLVATTRARRAALAARLKHIADEYENSAGARIGIDATAEPVARPAPREMVTHACATCRGFCCTAGGDHAYLDRATFGRLLARSPTLSLEALQEAYLSRIPEQSYRDSCVFHGSSGCTLGREMRADKCNDFFCSGVRDLPADCGEPRLAAAVEDGRVVRLAVIGGGIQTLLFEEGCK
jgi:hypothetical protein